MNLTFVKTRLQLYEERRYFTIRRIIDFTTTIYIRFLIYFHCSTLYGSRGWLQSTEDIEEKYYNQFIYY